MPIAVPTACLLQLRMHTACLLQVPTSCVRVYCAVGVACPAPLQHRPCGLGVPIAALRACFNCSTTAYITLAYRRTACLLQLRLKRISKYLIAIFEIDGVDCRAASPPACLLQHLTCVRVRAYCTCLPRAHCSFLFRRRRADHQALLPFIPARR